MDHRPATKIPSTPSLTMLGVPPAKVAITGMPTNIASQTLLGLFSICDGWT